MAHLQTKITCRIKIDDAHKDALNEALGAVQTGRAACDVSVDELLGMAKEAERMLDRYNLPKGSRKGASLAKADGGASAKKYKFSRPVTRVVIERGSSAWYLVLAERVSKFPQAPAEFRLTVTPEIQAEIHRQVNRGFTVRGETLKQAA